MDQLVELLKQIEELAGVGIDAITQGGGGGKPSGDGGGHAPTEGGAPHGAPPEAQQ